MLYKHFDNIEQYLKKVAESQQSMSADQSKLVELIPLSAAASGMIAGDQQLRNLESRLTENMFQAIQNLNRNPDTEKGAQTNKNVSEGTRFRWGDRVSVIPKDFEVPRKMKLVETWRLWWQGYFVSDTEVRVPPFRELFLHYAQDIRDAYRET